MLCIVTYDFLLIWNPLIKEYRCLSFCHPKVPYFKDIYGIGYDSAADDYKVFRAPENKFHQHQSVEVFSLKSNSWKIIQDNFPYFASYSVCSLIVTNGGIHWVARRDIDYETVIVYFDVVGEKLGEIPLPHIKDMGIPRLQLLWKKTLWDLVRPMGFSNMGNEGLSS